VINGALVCDGAAASCLQETAGQHEEGCVRLCGAEQPANEHVGVLDGELEGTFLPAICSTEVGEHNRQ
jgi:hypothetical protein